jgi:carboxymethylenebutenolidase
MRTSLASLVLMALARALPAGAEPTIIQEWVVVESGDRQVHAYLVHPQEVQRTIGVVLIHEIFGLSDWVTSVADRLAEEGYVAIAPDLLSGMGPEGGRTPDFASSSDVTRAVSDLPSAQVTADLRAVTAYMGGLAQVGPTAVGGFCWGGAQTFAFATQEPGLAAAFVFYGTGPEEETALARIDAPVYGFYGGNDARVNATVPATVEAMQKAGKFYEPVTYEGAGHGFMRSGEGEGATQANRQAREQAWARWLGLLDQLGPAAPSAVEDSSWGEVKSP